MSNTPINVCGYPKIADTAGVKADERARFEAWFATSGFWNDAITWKAWKAAIAAPPAPSSATAVSASERQEPVAWLHTMHVKGVQTGECLSFSDKDPWHDMWRYYGEEYVLVSKPLVYTHHPSGD